MVNSLEEPSVDDEKTDRQKQEFPKKELVDKYFDKFGIQRSDIKPQKMKSNAFDPNRTTLNLISYLQESPETKNKRNLKTEISEPSLRRGPTLRGSLEPPVHDLLVPHKSKIIRMLQEDIKTEFNQRQYSHALRGR